MIPNVETQQAAQNTDIELWRTRNGDYYADSIHVTQDGNIGINCGGHVIVLPLRGWHSLAASMQTPTPAGGSKPKVTPTFAWTHEPPLTYGPQAVSPFAQQVPAPQDADLLHILRHLHGDPIGLDAAALIESQAATIATLTAERDAERGEPVAKNAMADAAEMLWVVLANVSGGDWTKQSQEWREAAARWRNNYFAVANPPTPASVPAAPSTNASMGAELFARMKLRTTLGDYSAGLQEDIRRLLALIESQAATIATPTLAKFSHLQTLWDAQRETIKRVMAERDVARANFSYELDQRRQAEAERDAAREELRWRGTVREVDWTKHSHDREE